MEEVKGLMPKQSLFKSIFKKKMADLFDQIELAHQQSIAEREVLDIGDALSDDEDDELNNAYQQTL